MIGIVIVTHCNLGQALVECCEHIVGSIDGVRAVAIDANDNHEAAMQRIHADAATLRSSATRTTHVSSSSSSRRWRNGSTALIAFNG